MVLRLLRWACCGLLLNLLLSTVALAEWYKDVQEKMGTRIEVQIWSTDALQAKQLLIEAMAEFDRIEAGMSTYIPESELSRVNASAAGEAQQVSLELFTLLEKAQEISRLTNGAFDISFDSVGVLYDFPTRQKPADQEIAAHLDAFDYRLIELNAVDRTVRFLKPGVRINLGGIAKGYAVESVIKLVASSGIEHALATAGGDTRLLGDRIDKPWVVGIQDPNSSSAIFTRLALQDEAISTSGDYERYFLEDGVRYHHILSPADGKPARSMRSATIVGPDATMTDALSTSVFVLGPQEGMALINSLAEYEAVIITDSGNFYSTGLDPG